MLTLAALSLVSEIYNRDATYGLIDKYRFPQNSVRYDVRYKGEPGTGLGNVSAGGVDNIYVVGVESSGSRFVSRSLALAFDDRNVWNGEFPACWNGRNSILGEIVCVFTGYQRTRRRFLTRRFARRSKHKPVNQSRSAFDPTHLAPVRWLCRRFVINARSAYRQYVPPLERRRWQYKTGRI